MTPPSPSRLPRSIGLWSAIAVVIGSTIGSGIFRSPAGIAQKVPSPSLMIALWVAGGLITLCGALSLAELAAALPETGGWFARIKLSNAGELDALMDRDAYEAFLSTL